MSASDSNSAWLEQVKLFRTEDCPAKVASQAQRHTYPKQSISKPRVPDLPPGFEGNHYAEKLSVSTIPRIKWKRPSKVIFLYTQSRDLEKSPFESFYVKVSFGFKQFIVSGTWLMGDGGESTERRTENLRISKVLEAIYPHRSTIPSRYLLAFSHSLFLGYSTIV